ncbi:condensation domain-containing protein [Streptomyces sp. NPDC048182]|uniref:condensation domain-containing protein n=1 Tax=Streptomyces sp. NPDC048182 TaxID=3365507 RepID=UPI003720F3F8
MSPDETATRVRPSATERAVAVAYAGGVERRGPVTMGQANMIRCILRDDPLHINNHGVWPVPAGTPLDTVVDALRALVVRHEALRTTFEADGAAPPGVQRVADRGTFTVTVRDHAEFPEDADRYAQTVAREARAGRFRLGEEFPLRVVVLARRGTPLFLCLAASHAVTDGSALAVLRAEWLTLLGGRRPAPLDALTPLELAAEEATPAGRRKAAASLRYWEKVLATAPQEMFAEPRALTAEPRQPQLTLRSPRGGRALARVARRTGSPVPTVLLTAWCTLVAHRAGQRTCVVAAPLSNRSRPELARAVNTLSQDALLSLDVGVATFDDVLRKAWGAALNAYRHSQFDALRLWEVIDRTVHERGSRFGRDVVFNDVSGLAAIPGGDPGGPAEGPGPETGWGPEQVLPTRLLCFAYQTEPLLHLGVWADPALFTRDEAETFVTGLVRLLEAAADQDVPLADLTEVTGVRPAERGPDWRLVDGCWVSPAAVADALGEALGGLPVHVAVDEGAPASLTAFIARGAAPLTPDRAHAALMRVLPGRSGVLAPRRYVIVQDPPGDPGTDAGWLRRPALTEGTGRGPADAS